MTFPSEKRSALGCRGRSSIRAGLSPPLDAAEEALRGVRLHAAAPIEPVVVDALPAPLQLCGCGADAIAVRHPLLPQYVFKVYAPETLGYLEDEYECYRRLSGSPSFPVCFGRRDNYLILSYEAGPTLYECLEQGIPVDSRVIDDVERGRQYAREVGLHPKDVHLRNVLVQDGRAKLLDVSKYALPGDEDEVWDHLVLAYRHFYPLIRGRRIPRWIIELAKRRYQALGPGEFSIEAFGTRMLRILKRLGLVDPDAAPSV